MNTTELISIEQQVLLRTYSRPDMVIDHGQGVYLYDRDGKRYLDFVAGIAVNALGYGDPGLLAVIQEQASRLIHCSNLYHTEPQILFANDLIEHTFADRVFFSNTGSEAIEGAIKIARKWGAENKGTGCHEIVAFHQSFHGRTYGALSATGQAKFWDGFAPMLPGIQFAEFNNLDSVVEKISAKTCAILVEPIQGEGGVNPGHADFLQGLRDLADERGCLLILDEIQCGMGRTGKLFAHEWFDFTPDILCAAKPIAGGLPLGAILMTEKVAGAIKPGNHGTTFGGGPLATAVGRYVFNQIRQPEFLAGVVAKGAALRAGLHQILKMLPAVTDVRGMGLMVGADVSCPPQEVVDACCDRGLLVCKAGDKTIRFVPPLVVTESEIDEALTLFAQAVRHASQKEGK